MPSWTAERVVDEPLARKLIETQFPALKGAALIPLGVGWDNTAYEVITTDSKYVFRFPRRQIAVPLIELEAKVLPIIGPRLPVAVPIPEHSGVAVQRPSSDEYPWPFSGYRMLSGQTACSFDLSPQQRTALAEPIAHFLRRLHNIPVDEMRALGVREDELGKLSLSKRLPQIRDYLAKLDDDAIPKERILDFVDELETLQPGDDTLCLTHGDFYVRHLLLDEQQRLCGVIDWGDLSLNNPAADLSIAYSFLPPAARDVFFKTYGHVSAATDALARMRAITYGCILSDYAKQIGEAALYRESINALLL